MQAPMKLDKMANIQKQFDQEHSTIFRKAQLRLEEIRDEFKKKLEEKEENNFEEKMKQLETIR